MIHADVYTDGVIDVRDMLKLQRRVLGYSLREWFNALPGAQQMLAVVERVFAIDLIRTAEAAVANGKLFYIHTDHLGTPKALTNEAGAKVWSATHDPFGQATVNEDVDGNGTAVTFNLRYAGQYADEETGLHQNGFRTYDSGTGRYLESDPIGLRGGLNTYVYDLANPIRFTDIFGLDVNVCFYPEAAMGFGHVGLGTGGGTSGFYPTGNPFESPGDVHPDEQEESTCTTFDTDETTDDCVNRCIADRDANPGEYRIHNRQCTSFVRDCLSECGVFTGSYSGPRPRPFFDQLPR